MHCFLRMPGVVCSSRSGWTKDGLHPVEFVNRNFFSLTINTLADQGEACATQEAKA